MKIKGVAMEFKQFSVEGLFGLYNHTISFSEPNSLNGKAPIIMIYGNNGVGKTTVLRMIEGFMTLDFNIFRETSFVSAQLSFSDGETIRIEPIQSTEGEIKSYQVTYKEMCVKLDAKKTGPYTYNSGRHSKDYLEKQKDFVECFSDGTGGISFNFIDAERVMKQSIREEMTNLDGHGYERERKKKNKSPENTSKLATKVINFIMKSQVHSGEFFANDEPALFEKILKNIENPSVINISSLKKKIDDIENSKEIFETKRLGLVEEIWNKDKFLKILDDQDKSGDPDMMKLTLINSYLEVLQSRTNETVSLAQRLLVFENILSKFLLDKEVFVSANEGFKIESINGDHLTEDKLSTGEYHLLYLTTLTLCATVSGTVIAIDEPEMSMHIGWQNKLVSTLLKISNKANPQFIFATHSPDIAANYSNSLQTEKYERT